MSAGTNPVLLVAGREITTRLRSKAFRISTALLIVAFIALPLLSDALGSDETFRLATVGEEAAEVAGLAAGGGETVQLDVHELPDRAAAQAAVRDGDVDAALVSAGAVLVEDGLPPDVERLLTGSRQIHVVEDALAEAGVNPAERAVVLRPRPLEVTTLGEATPDAFRLQFVGFFAVVGLYMMLIFSGSWVSEGIVQEKSSRVIEVLLSTLKPAQLLGGKVLGIGVLSVAWMLTLAAAAAASLLWTYDLSLTGAEMRTIAWVVAWYIPGYALYAMLFAVAGALVPRQQDLQAASAPIMILLLGGFFVTQFALNAPTSLGAQSAGIVPLTAPMVQPLRTAIGVAPPWEIAAGLAATLLTIAALVPLTARLYRGAILATRKKTSLRHAWRTAASRPTTG